jgi:hypothetical protein
MASATFEEHPTDPDKMILRKPHLDIEGPLHAVCRCPACKQAQQDELWRKHNVKHNEQKHDNLSNPLDRLHEENVRLGLYKDAYDLSIKSDDLSIKSWVGLTDEEIEASKPTSSNDAVVWELAVEWAEAKLRSKNNA